MARIALVLGTLVLPLAGVAAGLEGAARAEDVVIRIEAKRAPDAARAAAEGWRRSFPDVVTFPLKGGWTGIALGPMPLEKAEPLLAELKAGARIPGDSFVTPAAGEDLRAVPPAADAPPDTPPDASAETPAGDATAAGARTGEKPDAGTDEGPEAAAGREAQGTAAPSPAAGAPAAGQPSADPAPAAQPAAQAAAPSAFLRLEASTDPDKAREALERWRQLLPEAGLWSSAGGRHAVALGPLAPDSAKAWLGALREAGLASRDASVVAGEDLGQPEIPGRAPTLGAPPAPDAPAPPMPPLEEVQRALRWAGHYDGPIDGKDGPMTRAAIARAVVDLRASPDPAAAMAALLARREEWRARMGLSELRDAHTGLALPAPMQKLQFDRVQRALSIYGPRDGSGAALILFSQPGGQQEMLDLAGLVTALGWVPEPARSVRRGQITLDGRNDTHIGHAEARVVDGRVQGFVLIWPVQQADEQRRLAAEMSDHLARFAPGAAEIAAGTAASGAALPAALPDPVPPAATP